MAGVLHACGCEAFRPGPGRDTEARDPDAERRREALAPHLERRREYIRQHPGLTGGEQFGIGSGLLWEGMTANQLEASWGRPSEAAEEPVGGVGVAVWRYQCGARGYEGVLELTPLAGAEQPVTVRLVDDIVVDADGLGARFAQRATWVRTQGRELPAEQQRNVLLGAVWLGATEEQARAALGEPEEVNRSVSRHGVSEQWVYRANRKKPLYVYVEDGAVASWQE